MIPQSILNFFYEGKSLPFRSMSYFNFLLEATLAGSVLIVVVLILRRVFRQKIGSKLVYLAWALVAVRLLLPVAIPNPLMDGLRPTYSTDAEARPVADQIRVRVQDAMSEASYRLSSAAYESDSQAAQNLAMLMHEMAAYTEYGWLGKAYLLLYVAGGVAVLAVFGAQHARFRRRLKKSAVGTLEGEQLALYQALCQRMNVKQLPVALVDPLPSPCLVGVLRPVIALPLTLPPDALGEALAHELCHYRALDNWWALLRCLCCAVHWFNPLVWLAGRISKTDCELACDERVIAGLTPEERLHYAGTLVTTAKLAYIPKAGVLATGMTMTGKRLKRRVNAILHAQAVRRAAAALVAAFLLVLTVAAFSTAESTRQTTRLTTSQSAFPFQKTDAYPAPEANFGAPVALAPLPDVAAAEAQAKRYLCALYPDDQAAIDGQYRLEVRQSGQKRWEVIVWPEAGAEESLFYMELNSAGGLISMSSIAYSNGDERENLPSVLPDNLTDVLLPYAQAISDTALQGMRLDTAVIHGDTETDQARYVVCDLYNDANKSDMASVTVRIAPTFQLTGVYSYPMAGTSASEEAAPPITAAAETLTYTGDASITQDAVCMGLTDSQMTVSPDATLTVRQAYDYAVGVMLERSGLSGAEICGLSLRYGYYDRAYYNGAFSEWRFEWRIDSDDSNRYWVSFPDVAEPEAADTVCSAPGEGLG